MLIDCWNTYVRQVMRTYNVNFGELNTVCGHFRGREGGSPTLAGQASSMGRRKCVAGRLRADGPSLTGKGLNTHGAALSASSHHVAKAEYGLRADIVVETAPILHTLIPYTEHNAHPSTVSQAGRAKGYENIRCRRIIQCAHRPAVIRSCRAAP